MANKFWDTVKNTVKGIFGGNKNENTSTGSSGAGSSASAPIQTSQPAQTQQKSTITSYNSGIAGTREYAQKNYDSFKQQYNLARQAGVSDDQFYKDYGNGIRWLDQANQTTSRIRQYNSGVAGTREYAQQNMPEFRSQYNLAKQAGLTDDDFYSLYGQGMRWTDDAQSRVTSYNSGVRGTKEYAEAHMDEFREQYQLAKQAGYNDDEFYKAYGEGTRWRQEQSFLDIANSNEGKEPGFIDKATSWVNDSKLWNDMQDRRMKRWQERYGDATFADDFWGQTQANYGQAFLAQELNRVYNDLADNPNDEHDQQYVQQLEQMLEQFQTRNTEALDDENVQASWISKHLAGYAPQLVTEVLPAAVVGTAVAAATVFTGGAAGAAVAAAWSAYRYSRLATSAINAYEVTRGASYSNLIRVGADANSARSAATDEAIISSAIEMGDTFVELFAKIPGLGRVFGKAGETAAAKTLSVAVKEYLKNIPQEGAEEFVQEVLSSANTQRILEGNGGSGWGGLIREFFRFSKQMFIDGEHADELAQAMEAAKGGAIIGAMMGGAHLVGGRIQQGVNNTQIANVLKRIEEDPSGLVHAKDNILESYLEDAKREGPTKNENAARLIQAELDKRNELRGSIVDEKGKPVYRYMTDEQKAVMKESLETMTREDITADKIDLFGLSILYDQCLASDADERIRNMLKEEALSRQAQAQQRQANEQAQQQGDVNPPSNPMVTEEAPAQTEAPVSPVAEEAAAAPAAVEAEPVQVNEPVVQEEVNVPVSADQSLATVNTAGSKYTEEQLRGLSEETLRRLRTGMSFRGETATVEAIDKELARRDEARNKYRKRGEEAANAYSEFDSENDDNLNAAFRPVEAQEQEAVSERSATETTEEQGTPSKRDIRLAEAIKDAMRRQKYFGKDMDLLKQNLSEPNRKRRFYKNNFTPGNVQIFNGTENNPGIYQTLQDAIENTKPDFDYTDEDGVRTYGYLLVYAETNGYTIELQDAIFYDVPTVNGRTKTVSGGMQVVVNGPNGLVFSSEDNSVMTRKSKPKTGAVYFNPATDSAETLVDKVEDAKYTESYASVEDVAHLIADKIAAKDFPRYREDAQRAAAQTRRNEYSKYADNDTVFGERTDRNNTNGESYDLTEEDEFDPDADFTNLSEEKEQLLVQTMIGPVVIERGTYVSRPNPGYKTEYENYWGIESKQNNAGKPLTESDLRKQLEAENEERRKDGLAPIDIEATLELRRWLDSRPNPSEAISEVAEENVPAANTTATVNRDVKISDERRKQIAAEREAAERERLLEVIKKSNRLVDGNDVVEAINAETGKSVEYVVVKTDIGDNGSNIDSIYLTPDGRKIIPASSVGENVEFFTSELKEYGVEKVVYADGPFRSGTITNGEITEDPGNLGGNSDSGINSEGKEFGILAFSATAKGIVPHEIGHRAVFLARYNNENRANALLSAALNDVLGDTKKRRAFQILKHREGYESDIQSSFSNWLKRHPDASVKQQANAYAKIEDLILSNELSSYILEGAVLKNKDTGEVSFDFSQYTDQYIGHRSFAEIIRMAGEQGGWSQDAIDNLQAFFVEHSDFVAKNKRGADINESANLFYDIVSGRRKQNASGEQNNAGRRGTYRRDDAGLGPNSQSGFRQNSDESRLQDAGRDSFDDRSSGNDRAGGSRLAEEDQRSRSLTDPQKNARTLSDYEKSLEHETPIHTDEDYRETYGRTGYEEMEQKQPRLTKEDMIPRDVTAEERAAAAAADYEQREQRAYETAQERRDRIQFDYGKPEVAWNIFKAAADTAMRKFDFDKGKVEDLSSADRAKRKAMDGLRSVAQSVAEGKTTGYEFAKYLLNAQKDGVLSQYLNKDTEGMLLGTDTHKGVLENVIEAYEDAMETSSPAASARYGHETERAVKMLSKRMERWDTADRNKTALGTEADKTVAGDKRQSRRKQKFNQSGESFADTAANFLTRMQINPTNVFRGLFGGWNRYGGSLGYKFSERQDNATRVNQRIISEAQMAYLDVRKMKGFQKFSTEKDVKPISLMGKSLNLSQQQVVALYKTVRTLAADQRQNVREIQIVDSKGKTQTISIGESITREMFKDMQRELWGNIDEVGKAYLEATDNTLEELGKQNADVEENVYGVRPRTYKKGEYIPIRYVTEGKSAANADDNIQFRFTQERTRKASGTVLVEPVTTVIDRYINQSANHIAYAELGDELALMNRADTSGRTLTEIMTENYGQQMGQWMNVYVEDMNNFNPKDNNDGVSTMLRKGRQAVQTGALVGSVSVPMKQISSYWAAAGKLRMSTLRKAYRIKFVGAKSDGTKNPLLYYRKVGGIDPTMSEIMKSDGLWAKMKSHSKILQAMEKSIPTMDFRTIDNLYTACALEVKEDNPKLDVKSQKYMDLVNEKFEDVVISTQPIFTRNARAEYARTNSEFIKMFSMFRTQQTQNLNRIMQAIGEARAAKGTIGEFAAKSELGETIKGQAASALSLSLLTVLADTVLHKLRKYKDEDDEIDPEKVMERIGLNAIEAASGTAWFADSALKFAIDTINKAHGKDSSEFYGVNMGIVSTIGNAAEAIGNLVKNPTLSNLQYTAGYISQAMGVPLSNAYRMINAAVMWSRDAVGHIEGDPRPGEWDDILRYLDSEVAIHPWGDNLDHKVHVMVNAELKGNTSRAEDIQNDLYASDKVNTAVRSEAKSRYLEGSISKEQSEELMAKYTDMEAEDIQKKNDLWEFLKNNPKYQNKDRYPGVSESFVQHYNTEAVPAGIPVNEFYEYMRHASGVHSIDVDGDGDANGKNDITKQSQIIEYINGLNLTKEQKDALWLAFGYKTTSKAYKKRPWK